MDWSTFKDMMNRHLGLSHEETVAFVLSAAVFTFTLLLQDWDILNLSTGELIFPLLLSLVVTVLVLFAHHVGQRLYGFWEGVETDIKLFWYGLLAAPFVLLFTNGNLGFFASTTTELHTNKNWRLTRFRRYADPKSYGRVLAAGLVAPLLVASAVKNFVVFFDIDFLSVFANTLLRFSALFVFWNMLPIPPLDGSKMLFGSLKEYVYFVCFFAAFIVMAVFLQTYSLALAFIVGIGSYFIYTTVIK